MAEFKQGDRVMVVLPGYFPKYLNRIGTVHYHDKINDLVAVDFGDRIKQKVLGLPGLLPHQLRKL